MYLSFDSCLALLWHHHFHLRPTHFKLLTWSR
ncbi:hypothetical protein NXF25_001531 [Crotalus adamanteus]|uniref:Uncharacterized protein n=1 Tax=Crotalus adamanteus TaxID=8729 RepID=A0AAW1C781_CROAD